MGDANISTDVVSAVTDLRQVPGGGDWKPHVLAILLCIATAAFLTSSQRAQQNGAAPRQPPKASFDAPEPAKEPANVRRADGNEAVTAAAVEQEQSTEAVETAEASALAQLEIGLTADLGHGLSVIRQCAGSGQDALRVTYRVPTTNRHLTQDERHAIKLSRKAAVTRLAQAIVSHPDAIVELIVEPEVPSLTHSDDVTLFEDVEVASTTAGTRLHSLQHSPAQMSRHLANFFHMQQVSKTVWQDQRKTLSDLLDVTRPTRIVVDVDTRELALYPEMNVIPTGALPLALAGNDSFTAEEPLPCLEIGPWLPVSAMCGSPYLFAFTEWHVLTVCIPYEAVARAAGAQLLPTLMWDPSYGFIKMMERWQERQGRLCLLVDHARLAKSFRRVIHELARDSADHRLQLFQKHVFAIVKPEHGQPPIVRPVWRHAE